MDEEPIPPADVDEDPQTAGTAISATTTVSSTSPLLAAAAAVEVLAFATMKSSTPCPPISPALPQNLPPLAPSAFAPLATHIPTLAMAPSTISSSTVPFHLSSLRPGTGQHNAAHGGGALPSPPLVVASAPLHIAAGGAVLPTSAGGGIPDAQRSTDLSPHPSSMAATMAGPGGFADASPIAADAGAAAPGTSTGPGFTTSVGTGAGGAVVSLDVSTARSARMQLPPLKTTSSGRARPALREGSPHDAASTAGMGGRSGPSEADGGGSGDDGGGCGYGTSVMSKSGPSSGIGPPLTPPASVSSNPFCAGTSSGTPAPSASTTAVLSAPLPTAERPQP